MSDFVIDGNGVLTEYRGAGGEVVIPDGVRIIGESAFRNCESISSLVISDTVESIEYAAFACCKNLKKAAIGIGVRSIGEFAFHGCSNLSRIALGKNVLTIGDEAFGNCKNMKRVYYSGSDDEFDAIDIGADNDALIYTDIYCNVILDGDFVIGDGYYLIRYDDEEAESLVLPACVRELSLGVFMNCKKLIYIDVDPKSESFYSIEGDLYSKDGKTFVCRAPHKFSVVVKLPEQITKIDNYSFYRVLGMVHVVVPKNVEYIGDMAFYGNTPMAVIELPKSIKYIGSEAFQYTYLKRIYYMGTESDWKKVKIAGGNSRFNSAAVYYYSETKPEAAGNYWHSDGEKGVAWEK